MWKADNVQIENLTACNFLSGTGDSGNQVWWNGGDGSGKIGLTGYTGRYLTGTSSFLQRNFRSRVRDLFVQFAGSGQLEPDLRLQHERFGHVRRCLPPGMRRHHRPRLDGEQRARLFGDQFGRSRGHRELSVRQQRGRGGHEHADRRRPAAAAERRLPQRRQSSITNTHSCWVFIHNNVHNNNNGNVPEAGDAAAGPIGTGMTLSGGRNDTVMDNTFAKTAPGARCSCPTPTGGHLRSSEVRRLRRDPDRRARLRLRAQGDALNDNTFVNDGYYANPSNRDFGQIILSRACRELLRRQPGAARQRPTQSRAAPAHLRGDQHVHELRTTRWLAQVECDTRLGDLPARLQLSASDRRPPGTAARPTCPRWPNPCAGVPSNAWCPASGSSGVVARDGGWWPVGRPPSGRCRRQRPELCAV